MRSIIKKNNDKSSISDTFKMDNITITDPMNIAENFCTYFTEIGPKLSQQIPKSQKHFEKYMQIPTSKKSLFLTPTDQNEVSDVIKVMKAKKVLVLTTYRPG